MGVWAEHHTSRNEGRGGTCALPKGKCKEEKTSVLGTRSWQRVLGLTHLGLHSLGVPHGPGCAGKQVHMGEREAEPELLELTV